jgi:serine phosphatase RsbU (regulator of sigma subunit)/ligand-binding sensor domain-containing protein
VSWFGFNDGSVFYTSPAGLKKVPLQNTMTISTMIEGPDGYIYVLPQGGSVLRISPGDPEVDVKTFAVDPGMVLFSASFTGSGDFLLGTLENVLLCRFYSDTLVVSDTVEGFGYSSIRAIHKLKGRDDFLIGTDGNGLFRLSMRKKAISLTRIKKSGSLDYLRIKSIFEDTDGLIWLSTNGSGIVQLALSGNDSSVDHLRFFDRNSGLPSNNIELVYQDIEGNYWIGSAGSGLSVLNSLAFCFYTPGKTSETNNIIYINRVGKEYFLGTPSGFYLFDLKNDSIKSFTNMMRETNKSEISSYHIDSRENAWIGTKGGELFVKQPGGGINRYFRSSGEDYINSIVTDEKHVWLGTLNGVILLDRKTRIIKARYSINNGLPYNNIYKIFLTSGGQAAVATKTDRLYLIDPDEGIIQGNAIMSGTAMNELKSFTESSDGALWASTAGNGVFEFAGDSIRSFTRADMMLSDYSYSILADSYKRIWIGHDKGFSRYDQETGIMKSYGSEYARGGMCNPDGMYESPDGKILIGTSEGFILYDRNQDKEPRVPPFNNINYISVNDIIYPYHPIYTFPYNKRYLVRIHFVGINLKAPDKVFYQTMLDNYDDKWSGLSTEREVLYSLSDGHYTFNMRSLNDDGLLQETPLMFQVTIKKPFWRTPWFISAFVILVTGIVSFVIRQREKAQKKIQAYLESELEARTQVVMRQKGEIELQNIEITDSINYAKRIQTSILPDFNKVKDLFPDAFLLFHPRDIVSGDFYWFDKIDDDRFILVCADSTGHGVPGAFMSMIGSTILQDIVTRQRVIKPSVILKMLDTQIFSTLNQNVELGTANDGMDMVVTVTNIKTRHVTFASAMRPVILVLDGEPVYLKGNRSSVGGESVMEKYFDDQEYYLNPGDSIYLFSDGLPDQFGGKDGKKMKIARLKKLIEDINSLPMAGQKEVVMKYYNEWKGNYEQVDDVLMIGLRL